MAIAPFGMTGQPGANFGGTNTPAASAGNAPDPNTLGSAGSAPFLPSYPGGTSTPPVDSTLNLASSNPFSMLTLPNNGSIGGSKYANVDYKNLALAFNQAGYQRGTGAALAQFLMSGAGFNPQVAQALVAAMQPEIQKGQANILEQFSQQGLRNGSPAAYGLSNYLSQVNLNEGQIWAQLYEQSVQNYMSVLMNAGKKVPGQGVVGVSSNMMQGIAALLGSMPKGSGSGGSGGGGGAPSGGGEG